MDYTFPKALYTDIMDLLKGIVIKRRDLAKEGETIETYRAYERYLACVNGSRYFHTFSTFDREVLESVFVPSQAAYYRTHPEEIPEDQRDVIVRLQAERVLATYEERNPYYRTLLGLPPLNTRRTWIYIEDITGVDPEVPLHELPIEQISAIELSGRLDTIIANHPGEDFEYLKYLGMNAIDLIEARQARPFDILRLGPCTNERVADAFRREYMAARRYVTVNFYNRDLFTTKTLYEPIIGLLILTLAVRNTLVPDEKSYLNYDEVLNTILDSYGLLRYFKRFPFTYKQRIVMALDTLLAHKGTDGVLVDVCKIFSADDLIANRYYLMKYQPKDDEGYLNFSGEPDRDYRLEFLKTPIETHDIRTDQERRVPYRITEDDYLWQIPTHDGDGNLTEDYRRLLTEDFNLLMSKYVDVEAAYDVSSLVFETCCFTNLLLYARQNLAKVSVINVYATGGRCSLFTMLIFLLATMAKRNNYDGNIVYDPLDIAEAWTRYNLPEYRTEEIREQIRNTTGRSTGGDVVWRFNYEDVTNELQAIIDEYGLNIDIDDPLVNGFDEPGLEPFTGFTGTSRILGVYVRNRQLYDAICDEMNRTGDIRHYEALLKCRNVLFTSSAQRQTFTKLDGTPANTYYELLEELEPRLARKVYYTGGTDEERAIATASVLTGYEEDLDSLIVYILERLEDLFNSDELKYLFLGMPSVYSSLIDNYIMTAINVFKASSVQLRSINVFFKFGDKDPIRVLDDQYHHKNMEYDDVIHVEDTVAVHRVIQLNDVVAVGDKVYTNYDARRVIP